MFFFVFGCRLQGCVNVQKIKGTLMVWALSECKKLGM